jgi:hypothetical protein
MATVEKFDNTMMESCLKTVGWKYLKDADSDCVVQFAFDDDDTKCELTLYLIREGKEKDVLQLVVPSDAKIPAAELGAALFFCNKWNKEKRWPKVYVNFEDGDSHGKIICEAQLDLGQGIHQELFNSFVSVNFSAGNLFWTEVVNEEPFRFDR